MYRDIYDVFDVFLEDIHDICSGLTELRDSLTDNRTPQPDTRSSTEKIEERQRENRELALRLAGSI